MVTPRKVRNGGIKLYEMYEMYGCGRVWLDLPGTTMEVTPNMHVRTSRTSRTIVFTWYNHGSNPKRACSYISYVSYVRIYLKRPRKQTRFGVFMWIHTSRPDMNISSYIGVDNPPWSQKVQFNSLLKSLTLRFVEETSIPDTGHGGYSY